MKSLIPFEREPELNDYLTLTAAQKDREIAFIVKRIVVTWFVAYKLTK